MGPAVTQGLNADSDFELHEYKPDAANVSERVHEELWSGQSVYRNPTLNQITGMRKQQI